MYFVFTQFFNKHLLNKYLVYYSLSLSSSESLSALGFPCFRVLLFSISDPSSSEEYIAPPKKYPILKQDH